MSNYLYAIMSEKDKSFYCDSSFKLFNQVFANVKVKLDTGCNYSTIPHFRLYQDEDYALQCKKLAIADKNIEYMYSYGVETSGKYHIKPKNDEEKLKYPAIKFKYDIQDFKISNYLITANTIYVNYDRCGNILIGMDILDCLDFHSGRSLKNGKRVFLGCDKDNITQEYLLALKEHFGYVLIERETARRIREDGILDLYRDK